MTKPHDLVKSLIEAQEEDIKNQYVKLEEQQNEIESQLKNIAFFKGKRGSK